MAIDQLGLEQLIKRQRVCNDRRSCLCWTALLSQLNQHEPHHFEVR